MEEQTNLAQAENVTETLFLDETDIVETPDEFDDSSTQEEQTQGTTEAEAVTEETATESATEEPVRTNSIKVKYNGAEVEVGEADIPTFVQKGMNYDHIKEELDRYRGRDKDLATLDEIAKANNMTAGEYLAKIGETLREAKISELMEDGTPREKAVELLDLRSKMTNASINKQAADTAAERKAAFVKFFKENPSVSSLPNEVLQEVINGKDISEAWNAHQKDIKLKEAQAEIDKLKRQAEISAQNEKNKASATPSVETKKQDDVDAFLSGLFG